MCCSRSRRVTSWLRSSLSDFNFNSSIGLHQAATSTQLTSLANFAHVNFSFFKCAFFVYPHVRLKPSVVCPAEPCAGPCPFLSSGSRCDPDCDRRVHDCGTFDLMLWCFLLLSSMSLGRVVSLLQRVAHSDDHLQRWRGGR